MSGSNSDFKIIHSSLVKDLMSFENFNFGREKESSATKMEMCQKKKEMTR